MKPVEFPGCNALYAESQPEYSPLPAFQSPEGVVVSCWELSDEEVEMLIKTRRVYLSQMTFHENLQPVFMTVDVNDVFETKES